MEKFSENKQAIKETLQLYLKLIVMYWRYTVPLILAVIIGTTLIFYIPPLVIADIISKSGENNVISISNGWIYLLVFGTSWLMGEVLWRLAFFWIQKFEVRSFIYLYDIAMKDLLKKDLAFFNDRFAGSITKNTIGFGRRFEAFFDHAIFDIVSNVFPAVFGLIILAFISPVLSLALLGMMVFGVLIIRPLLQRRVPLVKDRENKHSILSGHISDVVTNIGAVKAHGLETRELATHQKLVKDFTDAAYKSWHFHNTRIDTIVSPIYVATNVIGLAIILSLGVDSSTKAQLFLAYSYYSTFSRFLWSFNSVYRRLEESLTEAALFTNYMLEDPKITDKPDAAKLSVSNGMIEFKDVEFTHGKAGVANLFNKLNLTIKPGQKVGLVGHSGAGKSTLVGLLERFIDIDNGSILIDDQDISGVTQASLHKSISYVPQEPLLFHRTLRDNIAYGKENASEDEIIEAAKKANALDFIKTLPEGFDTLVGERGVKLSGGQRQRIAIARAILKDAPILVLDEATSALDSESEKLIQASLETLMKDRTSIVIAHRLSTISKLDRIIVLDKGEIIEDGSHTELLAQKGVYSKLWSHQSGGFIEE
ncbi:MAG TPA: ABC transporter ATP-binding protein [Candidatus Saccharimonadales bacterium]